MQTQAYDMGALPLSHYHFPLYFIFLLKIQADEEK